MGTKIRIVRNEPHIDHWDWETIEFTLYFRDPLLPDQQQRLKALIEAWRLMGFYRAFGGSLCYLSTIGFDENIVEWTVDMSQVVPDPQVAFDVLLSCLEVFAEREQIEIEKLAVGSELVE